MTAKKKDPKTLELLTTVDLNYMKTDDGKPVYQFVYGSQLYSTLFGIFAQFNGTQTAKETFEIESVSLVLLNYHGSINLGFCENEIVFDKELFTTKGDMRLLFGVQGTSTQRDLSYTFDPPLKINKNEHKKLVFCRILYPLPGNDVPGTDPNSTIQGGIPDSGIFDEEFLYRNGVDAYPQVLRPGMYGCEEEGSKKSLITKRKSSLLKLKLLMPSSRCHESNVSFAF